MREFSAKMEEADENLLRKGGKKQFFIFTKFRATFLGARKKRDGLVHRSSARNSEINFRLQNMKRLHIAESCAIKSDGEARDAMPAKLQDTLDCVPFA